MVVCLFFFFLSLSVQPVYDNPQYSLEAALGIFNVSPITAALFTSSLALSEKDETRKSNERLWGAVSKTVIVENIEH